MNICFLNNSFKDLLMIFLVCANRTACFCHPRKLRRQKILLQFKITILSYLELRLFWSLTPICLFHTNK